MFLEVVFVPTSEVAIGTLQPLLAVDDDAVIDKVINQSVPQSAILGGNDKTP